jgi:hypothetical protein
MAGEEEWEERETETGRKRKCYLDSEGWGKQSSMRYHPFVFYSLRKSTLNSKWLLKLFV